MNRIYRIVWNSIAGTWVVASELAKGKKKASGRGTLAAAMAVAIVAIAPHAALATDYTTSVVALAGQGIGLIGGDTVTTANVNEVGLLARDSGAQITAPNAIVTTYGQSAVGAMAWGGGYIKLAGGSVTTHGFQGDGLVALDAGTYIEADGVAITTNNDEAFGAFAGNGTSRIDLLNSTVTSMGASSVGVAALSAASQLSATNVGVTTGGAQAIGVLASGGGLVNLQGGSIITNGDGSVGLLAFDTGSVITADAVNIETHGQPDNGIPAYGADAEGGAQINIMGGTSVTTHGDNTFGLRSSDAGSQITTDGAMVLATGNNAIGALATNGGTIGIQGGGITVTGLASSGALAAGTGSVITVDGAKIQTQGADSNGIGSYGLDAEQAGVVVLKGGTSVSTQGNHAHGLRASGAGSQIDAQNATVSTAGNAAFGAVAIDGALVSLGQGTTINTTGTSAHGVVGIGPNLSINATNASINAKDATADGIMLINSAATLTDATVEGGRNGIAFSAADFVTPASNTLNVTGGSLRSVTDSAIYADAGTNSINLNDGAQVVGGNGVLLNVLNALTGVNLNANGNVTMTGDMQSAFANQITVSLANGSTWDGAARRVGNVAIDSSSTWNITGNSDVGSLTLGGAAAFVSPAMGGYKSLRVRGDLVGNGGTITLNTVLNEGGALSNQFTDRVLVGGNASGTTYLKVTGTGTGASTDTSGNGLTGANEGISLAQVAGTSSASSFALADGYIAVGPWRYDLVAYQPGASDAAQRVVAGQGSGFWDYRLQNAVVLDPTPIPTPDPTPSPTPRPEVVPQVPSYLSASTAMLSYGMRNLGTLYDRLGDIHGDEARGAGNTDEFYARVFGGNFQYHTNRSANDFGYNFDQNDRGIQIGGTWLHIDGDASTFRLGAYGSTGTSRITPKAIDGSSAMRMNASSVAATGTYVHGSGFYLDGVLARNYYNTRVDTAYRGYDMASMKTHGWTYSLEGGYPFVFAGDVRIEPQTQVIYQSLKTNAFNDADGLRVTPQNTGAWLGRVGANLGKTFVTGNGQRWTPWMRVNYLWSSSSSSNVTVASDGWGVSNTFTTGNWGQAWQVGAGITGALTRTVSVYANADYQANTGSAGEQGWSAGLGMRWQF